MNILNHSKRLPKKVGNVSVSFHVDPGKIVYADGAEKELYEIFTSSNPNDKVQSVLANSPPWAIYYHLSKKRGAVVDWYDFREGASVLEIGAGCGAITEALVKKNLQVTALEVDPQRALVNAHRNKKASNLNIVVENLQSYKSEREFDYVVCIGVLEYSGKYIDAQDPYLAFLAAIKQHLTSDGILLLAIENKLGMKYLAGAPEDHTSVIFDSINNYPSHPGIRTFSKEELASLLQRAGFSEHNYFFPHPDYKMPHAIFSEEVYPGNTIESPLGLFPAPAHQSRRHLFSEQALVMSLEQEKLYPKLANSFLIEASFSPKPPQATSAFFTQIDRDEKYAITTSIIKPPVGEKYLVRKQAAGPKSNDHIKRMLSSEKKLSSNKRLLKNLIISPINNSGVEKGSETNWIEYDLVPGTSLERRFLASILERDEKSSMRIVHELIDLIDALDNKKMNPCKQKGYSSVLGNTFDYETVCVSPGLIDLNLDNIIDNKGKWNLIDYEWLFDFYLPRDYIIGRIFLLFFRNKYSDIIRRQSEAINLIEPLSDMVVPEYLFSIDRISEIDFKECYKAECYFQSLAYGRRIEPDERVEFFDSPNPIESHTTFVDHINSLEKDNGELFKTVHEQQRVLTAQQEELDRLRKQLKDPAIRGYRRARSLARKTIKKLK